MHSTRDLRELQPKKGLRIVEHHESIGHFNSKHMQASGLLKFGSREADNKPKQQSK